MGIRDLPERPNPHYHIIILPAERNRTRTQPLPRLDISRERALMVIEQPQHRKRRPWWKFW